MVENLTASDTRIICTEKVPKFLNTMFQPMALIINSGIKFLSQRLRQRNSIPISGENFAKKPGGNMLCQSQHIMMVLQCTKQNFSNGILSIWARARISLENCQNQYVNKEGFSKSRPTEPGIGFILQRLFNGIR